jgi:hypothetical protein
MRLPRPSFVLPMLAAAVSLSGCGSATSRPLSTPAPAPAAQQTGAVGDTAAFGLRFTGIGYGPDRATYELAKPAYITMIGVTETTIEALMPLATEDPRIEMAGVHTTGLNRSSEVLRGRLPSELTAPDPRMAELQAYNRCVERGRAADKQQAERNRRIVGRDSAGRPIYGPPEYNAADVNYESQCTMPVARSNNSQPDPMRPAKKDRYLLIFVSDSPVRHETIVALRVSETEPRLFTTSIGRKLFGGRDAVWAGYFRPW